MPWREHIASRDAVWAIRLLTTAGCPPKPGNAPLWIETASHLLSNTLPNVHPALAMLRTSHNLPPPGTPDPTGILTRLGPLARLARGLSHLGCPADVAKGGRLQPGAWCQYAPLWGNPLLGDVATSGPLAALADHPGLRTLGDLAHLRQQPVTNTAALDQLWNAIPASWRQALPIPQAPPGPPPTEGWGSATEKIMPRLGWQRGAGRQLLLLSTNVRSATWLQLGSLNRDRRRHVMRYATSAHQGNPDQAKVTASAKALPTELAALWRTPWEPRYKEPLWRLINHGIAGAGHNQPSPHPCVCGWTPLPRPRGDKAARQVAADAWRRHAFWECPVALAVRREVQAGLPPTSPMITCDQIWLLTPPPASPGFPIHPGVWRITAAAAVGAMDYGRRVMHAVHQEGLRDPEKTQTTITAFFPNGSGAVSALFKGRDTIPRASKQAAAEFWNNLQDFADLNPRPPTTWTGITQGHPFLGVVDNSMRLNLPPGLNRPDTMP